MAYLLIEASIIVLLLQSIAQLIGHWTLKRGLLSFFTLHIALLQIHFYLLHSQKLITFSYFFLAYIPLLLGLGPLVRCYLLSLSNKIEFCTSRNFIHLTLPMLGFLYYFYHVLKPRSEVHAILETLYAGSRDPLLIALSLLCGFSLIFYAFIITKEQPKFFTKKRKINIHLLVGWASLCTVFILAMVLSLLSGTFSLSATHIGNEIVSIVILFVFIINIRYPDLFYTWIFEITRNQRSRQYLGDIDPEDTLAAIQDKMEHDCLYEDHELSLEKLAATFNLTRYQLSELLNDYARMSFHEFVGYYRVEAAKILLAKFPWKKIIAIGFDVGFNSQGTFNKTFKKHTGMTPSEFQKTKQPAS